MGARVESVSDTAGGVTVAVADTQTGRKYEIVGDAVLLATGRRPATAGLNLAAAESKPTTGVPSGSTHTCARRLPMSSPQAM